MVTLIIVVSICDLIYFQDLKVPVVISMWTIAQVTCVRTGASAWTASTRTPVSAPCNGPESIALQMWMSAQEATILAR